MSEKKYLGKLLKYQKDAWQVDTFTPPPLFTLFLLKLRGDNSHKIKILSLK